MTGIILAAGKSKRMGLPHSKVLLPLNGRPVLAWIIDLAHNAKLQPIIVVIAPNGKEIQNLFNNQDLQFVIQKEQNELFRSEKVKKRELNRGTSAKLLK